jgi:hypothetical protein
MTTQQTMSPLTPPPPPPDPIELATVLIRRAREAIEEISRERRKNPDLERLEAEIEALRERVERLEIESAKL